MPFFSSGLDVPLGAKQVGSARAQHDADTRQDHGACAMMPESSSASVRGQHARTDRRATSGAAAAAVNCGSSRSCVDLSGDLAAVAVRCRRAMSGRIPHVAFVSDCAHVSSRDKPIAVTSPIPVMATRRLTAAASVRRARRRPRAAPSRRASTAADCHVARSRACPTSGISAGQELKRQRTGRCRPRSAARCHPW